LILTHRLVVAELAHSDLDNIVSYIAIQLANPLAAATFLDEVAKCYGYLKSNPFMPTKVIASFSSKNSTLIYRVDEFNKQVVIVTVRYSKSQF
jgi:plasmid stabilization system protein ParE